MDAARNLLRKKDSFSFHQAPGALRRFLFPDLEKTDPAFRAEVSRVAARGLQTIALIAVTIPVIGLISDFFTIPMLALAPGNLLRVCAILLIGLLVLAAARTPGLRSRARMIGAAAIWACSLVLVLTHLSMTREVPATYHYIPGVLSLVMMVLIATLPLQPWHTLVWGASVDVIYFGLVSAMRTRGWLDRTENYDTLQAVAMMIALALAVLMSALIYGQRAAQFKTHQLALSARCRALIAENSASVGRLAAALSHELNTPIGALKSAVDSMLAVSQRLAAAPESERERLLRVEADLHAAIRDSAERLSQTVQRMQRFAHLEGAEKSRADINSLLRDVSDLLRPHVPAGVSVEYRLEPVAPVECRPQQVSFALYTLIHNAVQSARGPGKVAVSTRQNGQAVEVQIQDNGLSISDAEAATMFEPSFQSVDGRVASRNWSLFSAKQIIHEHGGEIRVESRSGEGREVRVLLPAAKALRQDFGQQNRLQQF